ncbi:MAG: hypothetical protein HY275_02735 [Gemmatimonadetes bacterium]|nr:hypothetical protein [Gemmatimonadota bacterium]
MRAIPLLRSSVPALALVLSACNPFNRDPVTEVTRDMNVNSRWRAALVTPAALGGAVQINGTGIMQPGKTNSETVITLTVANATPGGVHPWQVHKGQCGTDDGILGDGGAYSVVKIGDDGRGTSSATINLVTPTTGNYFMTVQASAANPETVVACGNLAPPAM